jgi:hypothetical protein
MSGSSVYPQTHLPATTDGAVSTTAPPEFEEQLKSSRSGRRDCAAHSSVAAATRDEWGTDSTYWKGQTGSRINEWATCLVVRMTFLSVCPIGPTAVLCWWCSSWVRVGEGSSTFFEKQFDTLADLFMPIAINPT